MKITAILSVLALGSGAMGYTIDAYTETHCKGDPVRINIHDNTCRDSDVPDDTRSVKLVGYGAHRQRAALYEDDWCNFYDAVKEFWVDGGSVKKGECVTPHAKIKAFASWSR